MNGQTSMDRGTPSLCFVNCIESGPMEQQAILLARSIQKWGGRFANCKHYMISPRMSAPLARDTVEVLKSLRVEIMRIAPNHQATWYANLNKATALEFVERIASEEAICWLDSDVLMIEEPNDLELSEDIDFKAMPASTTHDIGVDIHKNNHAEYWKKFCSEMGLDFKKIPVIPSQMKEATQMNMYWQGGVFVYRRNQRLGAMHKEMFLKRLETKIASVDSGVYFYDQTSLALAVWQKQMQWSVLDEDYNFAINKLRSSEWDAAGCKTARILHYFGSLWEDSFVQFVEFVGKSRPDVADFVASFGPLRNQAGWWQRLLNKWLSTNRKKQFRAFEQLATAY